MRDIPQRLFKYYGPDRSDVLLARLIKFTPLGEFNDPFEGRPNYQGFASEDTTKRLFEENLLPELLKGYDGLPREMRSVVSKDVYLQRMIPAMRGSFPALQEMLQQVTTNIISTLPERFDAHIGALCLSEVCDSLLMWAHYSLSHTGFALELNAHHSFFHAQKSENDELRHIRRVLYRDARPAGAVTELEGSEVFLVKSSHWSHEREWRMFLALADADQIVESTSTKSYLYRLPADAISGVVLGARASPQLREAIEHAVQNAPELAHVRIRSCQTDPSEFVLRVREGAI